MSAIIDQPKGVLYHTVALEESYKLLSSNAAGLKNEEAASRLVKFGKNELAEGKKKTLLMKFLEQFKNVMVIVLLVAAVISGVMGELADSIIIMFVVVLNAILGVVQESKAEKALEALKSMSKPFAKVKRNDQVIQIKSEEIVPGDIVLVEAGDFIPADMRLLQIASLKIEEAALTGESVPVDKFTEKIEKTDIVIGDRKNMAYLGSSVTYGRGTGIVTATGMNTEVGKIANYLAADDNNETPLQKKLAELGTVLSIGVLVIALIVFVTGVLRGREYLDMFLTSVSLAVAAIPEGLPAIVTILLAIGVQKMSKRNSIVRKLPAVETLGSTEIICSDKTGTLTQNKMTVRELYTDGKNISATEAAKYISVLELPIQIMTLCNDSRMTRDEKGVTTIGGDPTETALVSFAADNDRIKYEMDSEFIRSGEIPFDSDRKLMTTINKFGSSYRILTKGAPDILIDRCTHIIENGSIKPINASHIDRINKANSGMASKALRVLAVAYRDIASVPENMEPNAVENSLIFAGLIGMIDPPRLEVKEAVRVCREAGIRPVMITGDHRDTATAIAKELNIISNDSEVLTGNELDKIEEQEFIKIVSRYSVYARVSPEHKVRIVKAWKANGKVVAMTGDGVNDAPALKTSDIGIGMGITGTDVAKGVSDMVLTDDNFATIVLAVEEGRKIYSNIRKAIQFLLSANMGEVLTLFLATMLNWTILYPIHILWINLVTDSFPALALGMEKAEKDIMKQKPRKSNNSIFSEGMGAAVLYQGFIEGIITLLVYYFGNKMYSHETAITMAFVSLGLIQLTHSMNVRSSTKSIFQVGLFSNRYLLGAIAISAFLQVTVVLVPFLNSIFRVTPLNIEQWLIVIASSIAIIPIVELVKLITRLRKA